VVDVLEPLSPEQREAELRTNLRFIARALRRIEAGEDLEPELRNLRTFILACLEGTEPSKALVDAADELYRRRTSWPTSRSRTSSWTRSRT
jgi:hypothetical protein